MPASATSARRWRVLEEVLQGAPDPCPPSDSGVRGFSLLESVLVLGLLALTAAIVMDILVDLTRRLPKETP